MTHRKVQHFTQPDSQGGMSSFRKLVAEIHRRSVWQVLSVYLLASWGVLQVVDVLTQTYGLPDWVPPFALILLLIGLPVVLATAIVQEGTPSREAWTAPDQAESDEGALLAGEPHPLRTEMVTPESGGSGGRPEGPMGGGNPDGSPLHNLFTWRNALLGGAGAFAVLGLVVGGYFVLWATGMGPVGSLVAQGALDEQNRVVVADFGNSTADASLGEVVTEALRVDLDQSPTITVVDPSYVTRVLDRMGRSTADGLAPEVALELAQREGLKAVIRGEVAPVGEGFLLTASIVAAEDGRTLASFRETAADPGRLIPAIDKLSETIRQRAGESLPSIRRGESLEAVTTSSLDALRSYSRAVRVDDQGRPMEAAALLEEALERDPAFAMAWRKLAVNRSNVGAPADQVVTAATKAWEHRHRLTEKERYQAEAFYDNRVTGDDGAVERAYRRVLELDPDDRIALNNLALLFLGQDRHREARELVERAVGGPGESMVAHHNLIEALLALGETEEAQRAVERFGERYIDHPLVLSVEAILAFHRGERGRVHALGRSLADDGGLGPAWWLRGSLFPSLPDLATGRVGEARERIEATVRVAFREGWGEYALPETLEYLEIFGKTARNPSSVASAVEEPGLEERFRAMEPRDRPYGELITVLIQADRDRAARNLYGEWLGEVPEGALGAPYERERAEVLAGLLVAEGNLDDALELLEDLRAIRRCQRCYRLERADILVALGRTGEAADLLESQTTEPEAPITYYYPLRRVMALERLGPLYEEMGDSTSAIQAYRSFADAWSDADPELQPRVERARERIRALEGAL